MTQNLRSARLLLRSPVAADAGWIAQEIARPGVHRMLTSPPHPYGLQDARAWLAAQTEGNGTHVIEADAPLGIVTLRYGDPTEHLGYWLRQDAWGKGYMTEAAGALIDRHFDSRRDDLLSGHIADNTASRRVLQKLGFKDAGIFTARCNFRDADVEIQQMILTAADWAARPRP